MSRFLSVAGTVLVLASPVAALGQASSFQLEATLGASVPVSTFSDGSGPVGEATTGPSFSAHFSLARGPVDVRVGFSEHRFTCGEGRCAEDVVSTGWDLGLRWNLIPGGAVVPWLEAGATAQIARAELFDPGADPAGTFSLALESDRGWGWVLGGGLFLRVSERFGFNPGLRYSRVTPSFGPPIGDLESEYWIATVGLVLGF